MKYQQHSIIFVLASALATHVCTTIAFTFSPSWTNIFKSKAGGGSIGKGGSRFPPPPPPRNPNEWASPHDDDSNEKNIYIASILGLFGDSEIEEEVNSNKALDNSDDSNDSESKASASGVVLRGGSTSTKDIVAGTKASFETTKSYWSDAFASLKKRILPQPSKSSKGEEEIDPRTILVQAVTAPESDLLPDSIVRSAAQRSGIIGSVMKADRINECAKRLKEWYVQRGYVLHSVTGATLHTENATATLNVQEPVSSSLPIDIRFAKEVPIDPETGETTTMRKYQEQIERKKGRALRREEWSKIASSLNTTLIETKGRTNPKTLSQRLGLSAGEHFRWNGRRWQNIAGSGIFSKIWRASPAQLEDGTVQLQVLAQESPPRNLEYGVSKSLYTGHWEGELDFKHENIFGGGESFGVIVRRGAKDEEPSIVLRFTDDKFGMKGGYDMEVFSEYIAMDEDKQDAPPVTLEDTTPNDISMEVDTDGELAPPVGTSDNSGNTDDDALLDRKGLKFNLRGPVPTRYVRKSSSTISIERTSTRKGKHESIGSASLNLGPFINYLPLGAKASLGTSTTTGAKLEQGTWRPLPYTMASVTARQLFPLFTDNRSAGKRESNLALRHTAMASTRHLPHHEANAASFAAGVRGYSGKSNGPIDSSITGTAEIRVPVTIPLKNPAFTQDGVMVVFGDWMFARRKCFGSDEDLGTFGKSSIGIGLRKSVQGIPIKYDVSLTKDGKIGAFFGLGKDWDITE